MLGTNATAVKALSPLVHMPQSKHGSGKAIKHWRGSRSTPLDQNPHLANPGCGVQKADNRMQNSRDKTSKADREADVEGLPVVRPHVAGIDLGSEKHWACASRLDGAGREVEQFGATTPELERMVAWHDSGTEALCGLVHFGPTTRRIHESDCRDGVRAEGCVVICRSWLLPVPS